MCCKSLSCAWKQGHALVLVGRLPEGTPRRCLRRRGPEAPSTRKDKRLTLQVPVEDRVDSILGQYKAATQRRGAGRLQGAALCDKAESAETRELHQVNQRVPKQAVSSPAIYESGGDRGASRGACGATESGTVGRALIPIGSDLKPIRLCWNSKLRTACVDVVEYGARGQAMGELQALLPRGKLASVKPQARAKPGSCKWRYQGKRRRWLRSGCSRRHRDEVL
jgi:hypothetical protein